MDKQTYNKLKEEIKELKNLPGMQRGEHINYYVNYVRSKKGEEGVQKVKDTLKEMGLDIGSTKKLLDTKWISEAIPHSFFVAAARIFNWSDKEIYEMGKSIAIQSTVTKVFIKYFSSIEKTLKSAVKKWNKNFTRGTLEVKDLDMKNKTAKFVLKDFKTHPLACIHFQGFFARMLEIITGSKNAKVGPPERLNKEGSKWQWKLSW